MQSFLRFVIGLFMPVILIAVGGVVAGWGIDNDWRYVVWAGIGMVGAGIVWGLVVWLWVGMNSW
ncbi:hypothetical protein [Yoonia sp. 2307UL14-13]|uniref:hypothetical protein n=1 Tax=Yoonia sp. 2307UL14-13 TaxID=3126506 RepID=UPI0030B20FE8